MDIDDLLQRLSKVKEEPVLPESRHAAVSILVMSLDHEPHIVFQKRVLNIRHPGEISLPGGMVEKQDTSSKETAKRELFEEMGLNEDNTQVFNKLFRVTEMDRLSVDVFLAYTNLSALEELKPNPSEVVSIFAIPLSSFLKDKPQCFWVRAHYIFREEVDGKIVDYFPVRNKLTTSMDTKKDYWDAPHTPIFVYETPDGNIWGLTARIVYHFAQSLLTTY